MVFWGYFAFAKFQLNRNGPVAGQSVIFTDAPGFDSRYRCCDFAKGKYEKHKFKYATMLTDAEAKNCLHFSRIVTFSGRIFQKLL